MAIRKINSRSLVDDAIATADIADGSISTAKLADSAVTYAKWGGTNLGRRNLVINGAMQVAQRGTGPVTNASGGYSTVDRFFQTGTLGGSFTWEKSSDAPDGFSSSFKSSVPTGYSSLTSTASARIGTAFEGQDLQNLQKGTATAVDLTLSFWVKATVTGTYIVELYDTDNTRNICQSYTISASNTWQKVVMTFDGDTSGVLDNDNDASLVVHWWLAAGTNFTSGTLPTSWQSAVTANRAVGQVNGMASNNDAFYLTGVQLEIGDTATPFEHRSYGEELALCQRYYQYYLAMYNRVSYTGYVYHSQPFTTTMRAQPTITAVQQELVNSTFYGTAAYGHNNWKIYHFANASDARLNYDYYMDAEL